MEHRRLGKRDHVAAERDLSSATTEESACTRPDTTGRSDPKYVGPPGELAGTSDPARQAKPRQLRSSSPVRPGDRLPGAEGRWICAGVQHRPARGNRIHSRIITEPTCDPDGARTAWAGFTVGRTTERRGRSDERAGGRQ